MQHLLADESGQDLIEYVLLAAVLGLGTVACLQGLTRSIGNVFITLGGAP
jgi:pilus assembly protein Flp/PilA